MTGIPIQVYAINATVVTRETPSGKTLYTTKFNTNAEDAVDRIQACHDFDQTRCHGSKLIEDARVFKIGHYYMTFLMVPRDKNATNLITCRCSKRNLTEERAIELVREGINQAIEKLNKSV